MSVTAGSKSIATFFLTIVLSILVFSSRSVHTTSLTYKIDANEKACFYAWVDKVGEKIAFYFAVRPTFPRKRIISDIRFKPVDHLILITMSRILNRKLCLMARKRDKVILSLQLNMPENIHSASQMIWVPLPRKLSTLKLLYLLLFLSLPMSLLAWNNDRSNMNQRHSCLLSLPLQRIVQRI